MPKSAPPAAETLAACTRKPRTAARESYRLLSKCLATYEVRACLVQSGAGFRAQEAM